MTVDEFRSMLEASPEYSVTQARRAAVDRAAPVLLDLWSAVERMAIAANPDDDYRARLSALQALKKLEGL